MRLIALLPILVITFGGVLPAAATGTVDCIADADGVRVDMHGIVPYDAAAPLIQADAAIEAKLAGVGEDLGSVAFGIEHNTQYWLDAETLNLLFYREREGDRPFGATALVIKTSRSDNEDDEGLFRGSYDIEAYEVPANGGETIAVYVTGAIECFAG